MKISSCRHISSGFTWFKGAILVMILVLPAESIGQRKPARQIINPYEFVDWQKHGQYKANLNAHTMVGKGWMNPRSVVEEYQKSGYHILAITDFNSVTYPWDEFSGMKAGDLSLSRIAHIVPKPFEDTSIPASDTMFRGISPSDAGMVAVQGCGLLLGKHEVNSYFSNLAGPDEYSPDQTVEENKISVLNHPGMKMASINSYTGLFRRHHYLKGMEIFNSDSRHRLLLRTWDSLLVAVASERPIWGFSNDAFYSVRDLGKNWNVFLLPALNEEEVRLAMNKGAFYLVHAPMGPNGPHPPVIKSIRVDRKRGMIRIESEGKHSIAWFSNGSKKGRGAKFKVRKLVESCQYVRAELYGPGNSIVCTQPFFIR